MKKRRALPGWLTFLLLLAVLAAYFVILCRALPLILRKRELRRLSVELEMPEKELPAYLRRLRREQRQKPN